MMEVSIEVIRGIFTFVVFGMAILTNDTPLAILGAALYLK